MITRSRPFAILAAAACFAGALPSGQAEAAAPAWAIVAASEPTNLPPQQSEVQQVEVDASGGTYTLSQVTATGTGTLSFASGAGTLASGSNTVTGVFGSFAVGQTITSSTPGLIPPSTTITAVGSGTLTLSANATGSGSFVSLTGASNVVTGVSTSLGAFHVGDKIAGTGIPASTTVTAVGAEPSPCPQA